MVCLNIFQSYIKREINKKEKRLRIRRKKRNDSKNYHHAHRHRHHHHHNMIILYITVFIRFTVYSLWFYYKYFFTRSITIYINTGKKKYETSKLNKWKNAKLRGLLKIIIFLLCCPQKKKFIVQSEVHRLTKEERNSAMFYLYSRILYFKQNKLLKYKIVIGFCEHKLKNKM